MPVFNIPAEYYGLVGIGNAIGAAGEGIRNREDRRRRQEREDFVFEDMKQDQIYEAEERVIRDFGQGSKEHVKWRVDNKLPAEGIMVSQDTRLKEKEARIRSIPEANRTPGEQAFLRLREGEPVEGLEAQVAEIKKRADFLDLQIATAKIANSNALRDEKDKQRAEEVMCKKYNLCGGDYDALLQWTALEQQRKNLELIDANINQSNASAEASRALARDRDENNTTTNPANQAKQLNTLRNNFNENWQRVNSKIASAQQARAKEQGQKNPSQQAIDAYTRQINELRDQHKQLNAEYSARAAAITGRPVESAPAPAVNAGSNAGGTAATEANFPEELKQKVLSDYSSVADIDADPDATPEEKAILKNIFVAASVSKTAPPVAVKAAASQEPPPKEAPVAKTPSPNSFLARNAEARRVNKIRDEKERLTREISKLKQDIASVTNNPMSTSADKKRAITWRAELARKETRLATVNGLLED